MSSKRPTDHLEPLAKRRSDRQLTKDDASDDEGGEVCTGMLQASLQSITRL